MMWMTVEQAADQAKISRSSVMQALHKNKFRSRPLSGSRFRKVYEIHVGSFCEWMGTRTTYDVKPKAPGQHKPGHPWRQRKMGLGSI